MVWLVARLRDFKPRGATKQGVTPQTAYQGHDRDGYFPGSFLAPFQEELAVLAPK